MELPALKHIVHANSTEEDMSRSSETLVIAIAKWQQAIQLWKRRIPLKQLTYVILDVDYHNG